MNNYHTRLGEQSGTRIPHRITKILPNNERAYAASDKSRAKAPRQKAPRQKAPGQKQPG